jgi:hypothetical protein
MGSAGFWIFSIVENQIQTLDTRMTQPVEDDRMSKAEAEAILLQQQTLENEIKVIESKSVEQTKEISTIKKEVQAEKQLYAQTQMGNYPVGWSTQVESNPINFSLGDFITDKVGRGMIDSMSKN